jgi:hypothetical protein
MVKGKNSDKSSIEKLEDIGLREVSRKTYIELNYLKLMANKEFSKLQRIKTLGFIKIIQREYDINMDDWVREFEEYFQKNDKDKPKEEAADDILKPHKNINLNKKLYTFFAIIFLALFMIFAYNFTKGRTSHIESTLANSNITYYYNVENATNINISHITSLEETDNMSLVNTYNIVDNITNSTPIIVDTSNNMPKQNATDNKAIISPNVNIWVGIIDLATLRKRTYMQEQDIDLTLNKEQLVITGHGDFTLKTENKPNKKFNPSNRIYLYINNGIIEEINANEFILLNGGKNW